MFRDKEEELQRLEQLLAEAEEEDEEFDEEPDEEEFDEEYEEEFDEADFDEEELIREFSGDDGLDTEATQMFSTHRDIRVYNSDKSDVDMEEYSNAVFSGGRKPVLPWVFAVLTVVVLLVLYLALKQGGYLG